jgi:UDP-N-acetyl-2-amino-2-deoxyglucuronate dehydrogenase
MSVNQPVLKTVVIGCGRISRSHLAAVASQPDLAKLVAVVDERREQAETAAKNYGASASYTSLDELFKKNSDFDAVVICLPNDLHAPVAIRAAEAGKHVLIEKPMANTAEEATAIAAAAKRAGIVMSVAQCRRHFNAMYYLIENSGRFGELISVQVSLGVKWDDAQAAWWKDPQQAGGLVIALNGPHVLDFVQMVMIDDPLRVHAEAVRRQAYWQGEDEAMILLAYPKKRLASVHLSFNQSPVEDRKVLLFEKGTVEIDADRRLTFNGEVQVEPGDDEKRHYLDEAIEFRRQFREFVLATRGERNRSVMQDDGVRLIRTLDAVRKAYFEHTVVSLAPGGTASSGVKSDLAVA